MKIEIEVKAYGKVEVQGTEDAFKSTELVRVLKLPKETTLGELESLLTKLFEEVESEYANPELCHGKITIRAKKENGGIVYVN
ncbi:hypothetical protein ACP26L_27495 [Paenibacillus sp. S-38]|uniref:hypothetical protein n=1 Tax=Paenibacillus sp. S-38 TaxID=3416710 RepID=UPI003CF24FB1